tara:strand:- start:3725 stop:3916 length:192 start_codon:yes stop_codon:yes gene_type:complete
MPVVPAAWFVRNRLVVPVLETITVRGSSWSRAMGTGTVLAEATTVAAETLVLPFHTGLLAKIE